MKDIKTNTNFFLLCFALIGYLSWMLLEPMVHTLLFAGILAGSFYPVKNFLISRLKLKESTSSLLTTLLIIVGVIVPTIYITIQLSSELLGAYASIRDGLTEENVQNFLFGDGKIATRLRELAESLNIEYTQENLTGRLLALMQQVSGRVINFINSSLSNTMGFVLNFFIMLVVIYAFLDKGSELKRYIFKLSPLPDEQEDRILKKFNQMNYVTLVCNGVAGLIQGVLGGVGLWVAGVQSVVFWMVVMTILAFIPLVGIGIVYIPVAIYFLISGSILNAILLTLFYLIVSLWTENVFKSKFIGSRIQINSILVLLSIIGGMKAFGVAGIFYGPLVIAIFMTMVDIYHDNYERFVNR